MWKIVQEFIQIYSVLIYVAVTLSSKTIIIIIRWRFSGILPITTKPENVYHDCKNSKENLRTSINEFLYSLKATIATISKLNFMCILIRVLKVKCLVYSYYELIVVNN